MFATFIVAAVCGTLVQQQFVARCMCLPIGWWLVWRTERFAVHYPHLVLPTLWTWLLARGNSNPPPTHGQGIVYSRRECAYALTYAP